MAAVIQPGFLQYCHNMAHRLAAVTPGAKSDPFFINRTISHFLLGVDHPDKYREHVVGIEKRRAKEAEKLNEAIRLAALVKETAEALADVIEVPQKGSKPRKVAVERKPRRLRRSAVADIYQSMTAIGEEATA